MAFYGHVNLVVGRGSGHKLATTSTQTPARLPSLLAPASTGSRVGFGSNGIVVTTLLNQGEKEAIATDVAVQDDGSVVAVGGAAPDGFVDYRYRFAVARLLAA
jgi:hypothetical protein